MVRVSTMIGKIMINKMSKLLKQIKSTMNIFNFQKICNAHVNKITSEMQLCKIKTKDHIFSKTMLS